VLTGSATRRWGWYLGRRGYISSQGASRHFPLDPNTEACLLKSAVWNWTLFPQGQWTRDIKLVVSCNDIVQSTEHVEYYIKCGRVLTNFLSLEGCKIGYDVH